MYLLNDIAFKSRHFICVLLFTTSALLADENPAIPYGQESTVDVSSSFYVLENLQRTVFTKILKQVWKATEYIIIDLKAEAKDLLKLKHREDNSWFFAVEDIIRYSDKLILKLKDKKVDDSLRILKIIEAHTTKLEAGRTDWLKEHVLYSLNDIDQGINIKNTLLINEGANQIHQTANKILLSSVLGRNQYKHVEWISLVDRMEEICNLIQELTERKNWEGLKEAEAHLKHTVGKWSDSIKNVKRRVNH